MIRALLVVCYLLGGEVFCGEPGGLNYTQNRLEYEHSVLIANATARIAALERQLKGASTTFSLTQSSWSTYIHWGMKTCPTVTTTTMVYSGQVGGGQYNHAGSGEYICFPNDPEYDKYNTIHDNERSLMYGAEYETQTNPPVFADLLNYDVPCSVCLVRGRTTLIIPGRTTCYNGWIKEYQGYLMGERHNNHGKGYVCMDTNAEALHSSYTNVNGALFYFVEGRCGSLKCPPYLDGAEIACVVCSNTT